MRTQFRFILLLVLLTLVFVFFYYGRVLLAPNSFLFSADGDGMKNYYTFAYYIANNNSNIAFEGMNYPYYEHFMYTDCHPVQAGILKAVHYFVPGISGYAAGILNVFMVMSFLLTALLLYLIFRKLEVNGWLSVFGALAITILNPQVFRLTGHLALSYSFFIPLTLYILLLYEKKPAFRYILYLILSMLFFFFTHAYLGMIASVLVLLYSVTAIVLRYMAGRETSFLSKYVKTLAASVIPVLVFYLFVKLTDTHTGRTTNPWGLYEYHATPGSVFLPIGGPLNLLKDRFIPGVNQPWEGWAYIGIVAIAALAVYMAGFIRKNELSMMWSKDLFLKQLFIASLLLLCMAALLPVRKLWYALSDVLDVIKQFRSIGRFAWAFFFIANIMAVYITDKLIQHLKAHKRRIIAAAMVVCVPAVMASEGLEYHRDVSLEMTRSPNLFSLDQTYDVFQEDCRRIDPDRYQAMIALPFFCIGSENFGKGANNDIYRLSFLFSYHLDLPMVNSYLTRTSIPESKNIMQLLGPDFYEKALRADLKSDKPFLVVCNDEGLDKADSSLIRKSVILVKREDYSLYEIDRAALFRNTAEAEYNKFLQKKDGLFQKAGFLVSDTCLYFSFVDFNQDSAEHSSPENPLLVGQDDTAIMGQGNTAPVGQNDTATMGQGNIAPVDRDDTQSEYRDEIAPFYRDNTAFVHGTDGCFVGLQRDYNILFSIDGEALDDSASYIARFWIYNDGKNFGQDCLNGMIYFVKVRDGKEDWIFPIYDARTSHVIDGNWSLAEVPLSDIDREANYKLVIKGPDRSRLSYRIDDLLFYDSRLDIYHEVSGKDSLYLFHNNHQIKLHK